MSYSTRALALALALLFAPEAMSAQDSVRLIDFQAGPAGRWTVVNDGVMGGVSRSTIREGEREGTAVFEGTLSLENNGGFASVRTPIARRGLAGAEAIRLKVRGDGQRYQLRLRRGDSWGEVSFAAGFTAPEGAWVEVRLPLSEFEPTFRGRTPRVPPLDPAQVGEIGIMLTDEQVGEFRLEIAWIEAVRGS